MPLTTSTPPPDTLWRKRAPTNRTSRVQYTWKLRYPPPPHLHFIFQARTTLESLEAQVRSWKAKAEAADKRSTEERDRRRGLEAGSKSALAEVGLTGDKRSLPSSPRAQAMFGTRTSHIDPFLLLLLLFALGCFRLCPSSSLQERFYSCFGLYRRRYCCITATRITS